jgi:trans-aconitate methyltransferase
VDSSATLIAHCRTRFPSHEWILGDMRTLSRRARFRGILAWDSFFHLAHEDQRRMFPIFRDYAAPGAVLMFTSGPSHGEAIGAFAGEPLYHASLSEDEYRSLLAANGFEIVKRVAADPDCGGHTVVLARSEL